MAKKTAPPPRKAVSREKVRPSRDRDRKAKPPTPEKTAQTALIRQVIDASGGILRLAPTWVPRSFLMPGRRIKLAPQDLYALGAHRGGIDERWFSSTTAAANDGAPPDEGLSYVVYQGKRTFTLRDAVASEGAKLVGSAIWERYKRWPVYSKFFDNM